MQAASQAETMVETGPRRISRKSLEHLPGWRAFGPIDNTFAILRDARGYFEASEKRFGLVFTSSFLGSCGVRVPVRRPTNMCWSTVSRPSPRSSGGRSISTGCSRAASYRWISTSTGCTDGRFRLPSSPARCASYFERLDLGIAEWLDGWRAAGSRRVYPEMKRMTLSLAARSFLGLEPGPEADALSHAFVAEVAATISWPRAPLPFTTMSKGVKARAWLVGYLVELIRIRRDGDGADLLSELCRARLDDGRLLTDQEIADHLNMLMMAADDTLASSLTTFVSLLAAHRDWQTQLREEVLEVRTAALRSDAVRWPRQAEAYGNGLQGIPLCASCRRSHPSRAIRSERSNSRAFAFRPIVRSASLRFTPITWRTYGRTPIGSIRCASR